MKKTIDNYFNKTSQALKVLNDFSNEIEKIVQAIVNCQKSKKKILVAGNGGSSADSDHFVGELTCTFNDKNREAFSERFKRWEERCELAHGKAEIIISKQRHGPTGNIQIQFESQFTRFLDLIQDNERPSKDY